jgi:cyclopropane fatty-acyl-phospholipid synthase-like methyltransferase
MAAASRDRVYFDRMYARQDDPWHFRTSTYEREKYRATLAALPRDRYLRALEIGCSIGELTYLLGQRCENVLGIDTASAALRSACHRCAGLSHVSFRKMHVPSEWPAGHVDLLVLSEVLYFLSGEDIDAVAAHARHSLESDGTILLVNWLGPTDSPCSGDEAASRFIEASTELCLVGQTRTEAFRIDVLERKQFFFEKKNQKTFVR